MSVVDFGPLDAAEVATRKDSESMFVRSPESQPCHGHFGGKLGSVRTQTSDNYRE